MEHATAVRRGQPAGQVDRDLEDPGPRHRPRELVEALAAHELGDEVALLAQLADAEDGHHVRVVQPRGGARLDQDALPRQRAAAVAEEELHRDRAVEQRVVGEHDLTHATPTERSEDPVLVELRRRRPWVRC